VTEVLHVDHGGAVEEVAGGDQQRRAQRHAPAVPVHEQHLSARAREGESIFVN
jgi:hypothetical protein